MQLMVYNISHGQNFFEIFERTPVHLTDEQERVLAEAFELGVNVPEGTEQSIFIELEVRRA